MLKRKSIFSAILAIGILATSAITVYADDFDEVTGHLDSCGDVAGGSYSLIYGNTKHVKSDTISQFEAYRLKAEMQAVNRNTGASLTSDVDEQYNSVSAVADKTVSIGTSVTVYGAHQVWGTSSDYWGKYTTVYD